MFYALRCLRVQLAIRLHSRDYVTKQAEVSWVGLQQVKSSKRSVDKNYRAVPAVRCA